MKRSGLAARGAVSRPSSVIRRLSGLVPVQQEGAAADAGALRLDQIEHELDRDRGVGGAAAGAQDVAPGTCGQRIGCRDHEALGRAMRLGDTSRRGLRRGGERLRARRAGRHRRDQQGEGEAPERDVFARKREAWSELLTDGLAAQTSASVGPRQFALGGWHSADPHSPWSGRSRRAKVRIVLPETLPKGPRHVVCADHDPSPTFRRCGGCPARPRARRLRRQQRADAGGEGQGELGRGAEPVSAPRRPDSEPGRDGEGLCRAGARGADRGDRGARQGDARSRSMPRPSPTRPSSRNTRTRRTSSAARSGGCSSRSSAIPT